MKAFIGRCWTWTKTNFRSIVGTALTIIIAVLLSLYLGAKGCNGTPGTTPTTRVEKVAGTEKSEKKAEKKGKKAEKGKKGTGTAKAAPVPTAPRATATPAPMLTSVPVPTAPVGGCMPYIDTLLTNGGIKCERGDPMVRAGGFNTACNDYLGTYAKGRCERM